MVIKLIRGRVILTKKQASLTCKVGLMSTIWTSVEPSTVVLEARLSIKVHDYRGVLDCLCIHG